MKILQNLNQLIQEYRMIINVHIGEIGKLGLMNFIDYLKQYLYKDRKILQNY